MCEFVGHGDEEFGPGPPGLETFPNFICMGGKASMDPDQTTENEHQAQRKGRVDRQTTTPFYLRMYCRLGGHHQYLVNSVSSILIKQG